MSGAAELPDLPHRVRLAYTRPSSSLPARVDALARAFARLAARVGVTVTRSEGLVGVAPGDGVTLYFDVVTPERLAWGYIGLDYGHPSELELRTADEADMPAWIELVCAELGPELVCRVAPGPPLDRARH